MSDGFGVDPETVHQHAASIEGPFSMVDGAAQAARQVGLGDDQAYGKLLQFVVPPILNMCLDDAGEAIQSTAELGGAISNALHGVAMCYEAVDRSVTADLEAVAEEIRK